MRRSTVLHDRCTPAVCLMYMSLVAHSHTGRLRSVPAVTRPRQAVRLRRTGARALWTWSECTVPTSRTSAASDTPLAGRGAHWTQAECGPVLGAMPSRTGRASGRALRVRYFSQNAMHGTQTPFGTEHVVGMDHRPVPRAAVFVPFSSRPWIVRGTVHTSWRDGSCISLRTTVVALLGTEHVAGVDHRCVLELATLIAQRRAMRGVRTATERWG